MKDSDSILKELQRIPNVGPSIALDLVSLGVRSAADLAKRHPDEMYASLCSATNERQDPCVWDVFASAVAFAKGGPAQPWWNFTAERKARIARGDSPVKAREAMR